MVKCDVRLPYRMHVVWLHFVFTLFGVSCRDNLSCSCPHMFPHHMAHVMHVMYSTHTCIDQFLSLHSLVFQPHDILGHMICVCSIKIIHLESRPKSLSKLKCHKGIVWICKLHFLYYWIFTEFPNARTVGRFLLLKRGAGPPNWCPVRPKMPGEDGCFGDT